MIIARDENGMPVEAVRDEFGVSPRGFCPCCGKQLTARVGEVRRPHWAHDSGERCDEWWEEESEWRSGWVAQLKKYSSLDLQNTLEKNGVRHFYDVKDAESRVWVFRRRKLSSEHVKSRESFFGKMLWFVEAKDSEYEAFQEVCSTVQKKQIAKRTYYWGRGRPGFFSRWEDCSMPVLFDFASASNGQETTLWCVLRDSLGDLFVLEFPRDDFFERMNCDGRLFKGGFVDIVEKLSDMAKKKRETQERNGAPRRIQERGSSYTANSFQQRGSVNRSRLQIIDEKPVFSREKQLPVASDDVTQPVASETFEQRVAKFEKLGFNRVDAEARAKYEL